MKVFDEKDRIDERQTGDCYLSLSAGSVETMRGVHSGLS
jgi:hypothetical protein